MDKHEEKKLEEFVDRLMADAPLESPSVDFTKNLMLRIEAQSQKEAFQYKPIMSRSVLVGLFVAFSVLMVYVISQYDLGDGTGWFDKITWEPNFKPFWGWLENYTSSKVLVYAVLLFGLLFFVQVPWLKKHMDRTAMLE
ncbi:hypothetical protein [Flagellimonas sediminis]|uniref:Uncharacterized protein n=1 Tax=Flagellimonas sediminis TaxID=2696468 RepID=A0A6I5KX16_9FLAO|nr:hypothetical protein [Allomuricauda sediminis]NDV45143.1 hypothetical protein [Allomuricauda sediminis]